MLFILQGIFSACHDIGGNHIILALWQGISNSPINAMHSGYGIGIILAIQLSKPFIKFDPNQKALNLNESSTSFKNASSASSTEITSEMIDIKTPYFLSAGLGIILCLLFLVAQFFEKKNTKRFNSAYGVQLNLLNEKVKHEEVQRPKTSFFQHILFGDSSVKGNVKVYMLVQICLIFVIQFCIQGHFTIVSKFMLPYLTKGPGKFSLQDYSIISTLFWAFFVVARLLAAVLAFKVNSIVFVFCLLAVNLLVSSVFLMPFLTMHKLVFWIGMSLMGLATGPCTPSLFMDAKDLLNNYNSFVLSLFSVGMGLGSIFFQQTCGILLDAINPREFFLGFTNFNSNYIISYAFFLPCIVSFFVYFVSYVIYRRYFFLLK